MTRTSPGSPGGRPAAPGRGDRGSASLEIVVLFPAVLALVFGLLQGALWLHARALAGAAAQEGVRAARAETGTPETGRAQAADLIADAGGGDVLLGAQVQVTADAARVQVVVTGTSVSLLPGIAGLRVEQSAAGPVERFTPAGAP
jgi:Flp pilus assembly protein TadG